MAKKKNEGVSLQFGNVWDHNINPIWIASTIVLSRNIEKFLFPSKLSKDKQNQIYSVVTKEISTCDLLKEPQFVRVEDSSPADKEYLYEHFLAPHPFQEAHSGEGFIIDKQGQFLATLNIQDHVHFYWLDLTAELEKSLNHLVQIEMCVGKTIHYAFSPKFGFLTSNSAECGTGLSVKTFLQVPALIHTKSLEDFLVRNSEESILVTGLQGRSDEVIGDFLVVQNNFSLGLTEENILSAVRSFTTKVLVAEQGLRVKLKQEQNVEMMDKVSRAYGILLHSYQIDAIEALNALSLVKLGRSLDWISGVETATINRLIFATRRAHLLKELDEDVTNLALTHKRSEYIHQALKEAKLLI